MLQVRIEIQQQNCRVGGGCVSPPRTRGAMGLDVGTLTELCAHSLLTLYSD